MAKITGPLMSVSASGSFGGAMVFSSAKGVPYVRQLVVPRNPNSNAQQGVRANMSGLNKLWAAMSALDKATWDARAKQLGQSPWNAFVKVNQKDFANGMGNQRQDPAEASTPPSIPTAIADAVEGRQATISWKEPANGDCFGTFVWISDTQGFTPAPGNLKAIAPGTGTPGTDTAVVVPNLDPGTYYYRVRSFDFAGDFGVVGAEGSFVVE